MPMLVAFELHIQQRQAHTEAGDGQAAIQPGRVTLIGPQHQKRPHRQRAGGNVDQRGHRHGAPGITGPRVQVQALPPPAGVHQLERQKAVQHERQRGRHQQLQGRHAHPRIRAQLCNAVVQRIEHHHAHQVAQKHLHGVGVVAQRVAGHLGVPVQVAQLAGQCPGKRQAQRQAQQQHIASPQRAIGAGFTREHDGMSNRLHESILSVRFPDELAPCRQTPPVKPGAAPWAAHATMRAHAVPFLDVHHALQAPFLT